MATHPALPTAPNIPEPPPMLPPIVSVVAEPEAHAIVATFSTGERRRYDMTPLLGRGVFRLLEDYDAFAAVSVDEMGGVTWESGPDLSRDTVYLASKPV